MDRWQGQWIVRQNGYKVRLIEPPLARFEMFMYVNVKHAALVPRVTQALVDMKADGTWQRIYDRCLKPFDSR
jgi:polar amino acid transport system substrate-binding protein